MNTSKYIQSDARDYINPFIRPVRKMRKTENPKNPKTENPKTQKTEKRNTLRRRRQR